LWFSGLFDDGYRPLIHALKYEHQQSIGEFFGRKTGRRLLKTFANCGHPPLIVPVPLHPSRERHRGYNQSAAIARGLARATGFPLAHDQLRRIRRTRDQTRLSPAQRIANVAKAFAVRHPGYFADRQVILVDDVLTTGATIKECTGILYADGAVEVQAMVIALARPIIKTAEKRGGSGDNSSALPQQPIGDAVGV